jgi:GntR family transcriptional regulator
MKIDKNLHTPLYRQVEEVLEEKITSRQWAVGSQLPSEQELADLFSVSRITIKRAVIELVNKGYLYRQRGKGTFVSETKKEQDINSFISLSTDSEEAHPHQLINFSIEEAGSEIAGKMNIQPESKVIRVVRLKIVNNEPQALEYSFLPYDKCPDLQENDINNELLYNILQKKFHILLGSAKMYIKPYILKDRQAKLLQVTPGTPVFEWERFTYTKQNEVIEYSKFYIRQDKETYYTEVHF